MDADFDPNQPSTSAAIQKEISKKARKRSKFSQALAKKKPVFDPSKLIKFRVLIPQILDRPRYLLNQSIANV